MTGIKKNCCQYLCQYHLLKMDPALQHNTANNNFFGALRFVLWSSSF